MTFVFPVLLGGLLVAGVPILLHFIMRQKPKTLPFPAFRFLARRQRTNQRKLRLRHLLLLALRVLLLVLICLALGRPRLFTQGLTLNSERPLAVVLVFDTSMSMDYRTSDKLSRLDETKKRGPGIPRGPARRQPGRHPRYRGEFVFPARRMAIEHEPGAGTNPGA